MPGFYRERVHRDFIDIHYCAILCPHNVELCVRPMCVINFEHAHGL